jgi:uncharacterized protein DUF6580
MIPAFLLIVAAVAYRIVTGLAITSGTTWPSNFAPMAAIALCAAAYFPAKYKFTVPMIALLVSDVVLNAFYGFSLLSPFVLSHYVGFALVGALGWLLRNRASVKTMLPASIAASVIFYVVTCAVSWVFDSYPKNFAGLIQSLTVGLPQYSATPSWMFFRNSAVSDLIFTGLFILCFHLGRASASVRATSAQPRTI